MADDSYTNRMVLVAATSTDPAFVRAAYLRIASIAVGVYEYVLLLLLTIIRFIPNTITTRYIWTLPAEYRFYRAQVRKGRMRCTYLLSYI